jgi:branched-chain amino acid transport system ATP-binding protein
VSAPVLELDGLTAGYDNAAVIRDISLAARRRDRCPARGERRGQDDDAPRRLRPRASDGRRIPLRGADLQRAQPSARSSASRTFREPRPVLRLTVAEHFRLGYRGERLDADVAYRYFPALTELRDRRCGLLSAGAADARGRARLPAIRSSCCWTS